MGTGTTLEWSSNTAGWVQTSTLRGGPSGSHQIRALTTHTTVNTKTAGEYDHRAVCAVGVMSLDPVLRRTKG